MKSSSWAAVLLGLSAQTVYASIAINGVRGGVNAQSGQRPARQDIRKLASSGAAWDLYIQALAAWQGSDQNGDMSYFQVAGIHGQPGIPWDGVQGTTGIPGYCPHGSVLFTTWHRPYLAAVEQNIWNYAQQIAQTYPDSKRAEYMAAAQTLRIPYWDWSTSANMPDVCFFSAMTINGPNGQVTMHNPLYNYNFHPYADWETGGFFGQYGYTFRGTDDSIQAETNVNSQLSQYAGLFKEATYSLLSSETDFTRMSNTGSPVPNIGYQSLENLHNIVHTTVSGFMSSTATAAFDPIFWLHHTNVDRLFAIWQAINPDSYVVPGTVHSGTFTNAPGSNEDINTPLTPFHKDTHGSLWTSVDARSTRMLGYTYPEVQDWNVDAKTLAANVRTIVNNVYNPQSVASSSKAATSKVPTGRNGKKNPTHRREVNGTAPASANAAEYQWAINYKADVTKISKSIMLQFYWATNATGNSTSHKPANVTTVPTFVNATSPRFGNATHSNSSTQLKDYSDIIGVGPIQVLTGTAQSIYHGQVPLTHAIMPVVPDMDYADTLAFLKNNLRWRAQWADGYVMPNNQLAPGAINITIVGREVAQSNDPSTFPTYADWTVHDAAPLGSQSGAGVFQPCNCASPGSSPPPPPPSHSASPPSHSAPPASPATSSCTSKTATVGVPAATSNSAAKAPNVPGYSNSTSSLPPIMEAGASVNSIAGGAVLLGAFALLW